MNTRQILLSAQALCSRSRTDGRELATDLAGTRCRPIDPDAAYWSPTGAVFHVEPWMSRDNPRTWGDTTENGQEALRLLDQAALARGYANAVRCSVDGGEIEEQAMFRFAVSLCPAEHGDDRRATR